MTRGNLNPGDDDPNKPPTISIAPVSAAAVDATVALTASVADDGLPKPRPVAPERTRPAAGDATTIQAQANSSGGGPRRGRNVTWMQLRGPARVRFDPTGPIAVSSGKAATNARFTERGAYVLRATANDGALSTRADITIVVSGGTQ